ncbi:putative metal-binding motif-containing protein [Myxococcus eversor]|uniref:putative metal-binding motif-containing protein n=1 Tax=Myxococcus eversor TaxID=2709661 RepID=UPI0013D1B78C|nr:putative metal-binding motif-containing protein [Myxococcus eversor]
MRRLALLLLPLLVLACSKSKEQAGQQVIIKYTKGFHKGCFRVVAQDLVNTSLPPLTSSVEPRADRDDVEGGPFVAVGVLQKEGWSNRINVKVTVHEEPCAENGKEVATQNRDLTLPGEGVSKDAFTMQFDTPDADDDGFLPEDKGGTDCGDNDRERNIKFAEVCDNKDNNCKEGVDEGFDKSWYLDDDGDGVPRGPDFVSSCLPPNNKYKHYAASGPFDCRDSGADAAKMFPGNIEKCDNLDNDCDNVVDNNFPARGVTCNSECGGETVCSGDGNAVVCSRDPGRYYYRDADGDGDGDSSATAVLKCQDQPLDPGYVLNNHGDCDDFDPAARSSFAEVCDAIDNNCDGTVDNNTAVACGGTLKDVVNHHVGGANHDWRTVSTGPSGYPVWIAGRGGKLAVRRTANSKFESFSFGDGTGTPPDESLPANSNTCGNTNWTVSWVNSNGTVFLGGEGGLLAIHTGDTAAACGTGALTVDSDNLTGMVGFEVGGVTTIYLTDSSGRLIKWVVGGNPQHVLVHDSMNFNAYGVHGLSESFLLVSGGSSGGDVGQAFLSYTNSNPSLLHSTHPNNGDGNANAVWMGRADKACAVGDGGLAWRWDGSTTWNQAESSGTTVDFSSVVMRYDAQNLANPLNDQCYIVDKGSNGKLRRLTPFGWAKPLDLLPSNRANVPLRDIAITATGNLWIVGDDGRVFHYPEP